MEAHKNWIKDVNVIRNWASKTKYTDEGIIKSMGINTDDLYPPVERSTRKTLFEYLSLGEIKLTLTIANDFYSNIGVLKFSN